MFSFEWPWMILLMMLPLLVRVLAPVCQPQQHNTMPVIRFPHLDRVQAIFPHQKTTTNRFSWTGLLCLLIWLGLVVALMRPQIVDQITHIRQKGYDLMLAVDLSGSMRALDFSTETQRLDRLDVTKEVVRKFVAKRSGDRVGLVLFGDSAYLHVPLTHDTLSVGDMLDNTMIGMAGDATAIGDAIGTAVKKLRSQPEGSRVIILLTDGQDTASTIPPLQAAKLAKDYGIRVYTIGVGHDGLVPFPDQFGRIVNVRMELDEQLLNDIATLTGGAFFRAANKKALDNIYEKIDKLEKTEAETQEYLLREPLYRYPLGFSLGLLLFIGMIPLYRMVRYGV